MEIHDSNVGVLATLLNRSQDEVKVALTAENALGDMVTAFKNGFKVLPLKDYETMQNNLKAEAKQSVLTNLKHEDIPERLRNSMVAWKLEELENGFKTKYGFDGEFKGLTDLVEKIVDKVKSNGNNTGNEEIKELKNQIQNLSQLHSEELSKERKKIDNYVITNEMEKAITSIGLDYDGEALAKQQKLLKDSFNQTYKIDFVERGGRKQIAVFESGKDDFVKDDKLDPVPIGDLMSSFAVDYGFKVKSPEAGGQGGRSSHNSSSSTFAGMTEAKMIEYLQSKGVSKFSDEGVKLWQEFRAANK